MAKQFNHIPQNLQDFIEKQHIFFVATAGRDGRVNLSPKGLDSLRVTGENEVIWLNLTGSGNETAAHLLEVNRMTLMFCSFEKNPLILRLYGQAQILHFDDAAWSDYAPMFADDPGMRQIFVMSVDLVQTSCGYAVPFFEFKADRTVLQAWSKKQGERGIEEYREEKNRVSLDGKPTDLF